MQEAFAISSGFRQTQQYDTEDATEDEEDFVSPTTLLLALFAWTHS